MVNERAKSQARRGGVSVTCEICVAYGNLLRFHARGESTRWGRGELEEAPSERCSRRLKPEASKTLVCNDHHLSFSFEHIWTCKIYGESFLLHRYESKDPKCSRYELDKVGFVFEGQTR